MGCTTSTSARIKVGTAFTDQNSIVQEESQSFRCNVKAVRYAIKDPSVRQGFQVYLETQKSGAEFLACYVELETMKSQRDDKLIPAVSVLLAKYQLLHEQAQNNTVYTANNPGIRASLLWGKLGKLKKLDLTRITRTQLLRAVNDAQHQMLSELAEPFEEFLETDECRSRLEKSSRPGLSRFCTPPRSTSLTNSGQPSPRRLTPKAADRGAGVSSSGGGLQLRLFSSPTSTTTSSSAEFTNVFQ